MENEPAGPDARRSSASAEQDQNAAEVIAGRIGRLPLIGRAAELARLDGVLAASGQEPVRLVVLAGEAGIGKSRLLAVAGQRMGERGGIVAFGRCVDEQGAPPFLPWVGLLAELSDNLAQAGVLSDTVAGRLDHPLAVESTAAISFEGPSPEQRKLRAFTAITQSLVNLARSRPLLLAFDDLQWADGASHELLRHVVIHAPAVPLVIVGTYRSEEAIGNDSLTRTLDELGRRRLLTTIRVGPLSEPEISRVLTGLGVQADPALVGIIHERSEGNPFVAEEMIHALAVEGRVALVGHTPLEPTDLAELPLPRGVAAVIDRRLARLSAASRNVLDLAALDGREISIDLLRDAAGRAESEIADCLAEAERAALVRAVSPPGRSASGVRAADYAFLHDRVREAVVAGIPLARRRQLHAQWAAVYERMSQGDTLRRLAAVTYHLRESRQPERAAFYAEQLGDAAMRAHAHSEAMRAYRVAVELGDQTERAASAGARGALLIKLGDATLAATGAAAIPLYREAGEAFAAAGDDAGRARALARRGLAHARNEELDEAITLLGAAVQVWDRADHGNGLPGDGQVLVETAYALVELCAIQGTSLARYDEAIQAGERALDLAKTIGDRPALEAAARLALSKSLARAGQLDAGQNILIGAPALAIQGSDLDLAAEIAGAQANQAYWRGDLATSERAARRRRELAVEAGDPFALRHALPWLALIAVSRGEWAEAERYLAEAVAEIAQLDSPEPHAFLHQIAGMLALARGHWSEAVVQLEEAIRRFRQSGPATLIWYVGCLAHAYIATGDRLRAGQVAGETAAILTTLPANSLPRAPATGQLGIVASWLGDRAAMERWYYELRPFAGQFHWVLIDRVMGMLAARLDKPAAAERHWTAAEATAIRAGLRPELAIVAAERALMQVRRAGPAPSRPAEAALIEAVANLHQFGMAGEAERYAAFLPDEGEAGAAVYPAGLTAREVAVLALLAGGLTNREIGERLGITEKTVTNHLTHIFTKAEVENRAAAVAFALRHGLDR